MVTFVNVSEENLKHFDFGASVGEYRGPGHTEMLHRDEHKVGDESKEASEAWGAMLKNNIELVIKYTNSLLTEQNAGVQIAVDLESSKVRLVPNGQTFKVWWGGSK